MITDRQEMFNAAWNGLKAQGFKKSMIVDEEGDDICAYAGDGGIKCAFGHCLTEDEIRQVEEGMDASHVMDQFGNTDDDLARFANELQEAHDYSTSPDNMRIRLINFAVLHNLKVPE